MKIKIPVEKVKIPVVKAKDIVIRQTVKLSEKTMEKTQIVNYFLIDVENHHIFSSLKLNIIQSTKSS